jgi:thioredoxin 1
MLLLDIAVASITDQNFGSLVLNSETLVLVEFFAPLCSPCKNVHSNMVELANDYAGVVKFFKLNVDDNQLAPYTYEIQGLPTVIFFKNGEQRDRLLGNVPKTTFIKTYETKPMRWAEKKNKVSARSKGYLIKPMLSNLDVMLS